MEIMEKIKHKIEDESHDIEEYMDLAEKAHDEGMIKESRILKDIAMDEKAHMKFLNEMSHMQVR